MVKAFTDKESKQALKAFETISNYCRSRSNDCGDCVFASDLEGICLFQDSVEMSDNRMSSIAKAEILARATELFE